MKTPVQQLLNDIESLYNVSIPYDIAQIYIDKEKRHCYDFYLSGTDFAKNNMDQDDKTMFLRTYHSRYKTIHK